MPKVIAWPSGSVEVAPKLNVLELASSIVNAIAVTVGAEFTGLNVNETVPAVLFAVPS